MAGDDRAPTPGGVHDTATRGYESGADAYEAGRPDYPPDVDAWLREVAGVGAGRTVLEVGAGAGALTSRLTGIGARVCAIEPVRAMRRKLSARAPAARVVAGTADTLPIRDAAVTAVVCAQAFHWFASPRALQQFHRVLAPDGILALVWNVRDETVPWVQRLSAITDAHQGDTPRYSTGRWREAFAGSGFSEVARHEIGHVHVGPVARVVVDRTLSVSFVSALPAARRQQLEDRLRAFIAEEPDMVGRAEVAFPYRTAMYAYRRGR